MTTAKDNPILMNPAVRAFAEAAFRAGAEAQRSVDGHRRPRSVEYRRREEMTFARWARRYGEGVLTKTRRAPLTESIHLRGHLRGDAEQIIAAANGSGLSGSTPPGSYLDEAATLGSTLDTDVLGADMAERDGNL